MLKTISKFELVKVTATGNDFLIADLTNPIAQESFKRDSQLSRAAFAQKICDRYFGLGADGLIFMDPPQQTGHAFKWDFYNSDGSTAEMCGNAARGAALYHFEAHGERDICFATQTGPIETRIKSPQHVEVKMPAISASEKRPDYHFVNSGVPHAVIKVSAFDSKAKLTELALAVKARPEFQRTGTNVTFTKADGAGKIQARTFERGVEAFTLSCGTGAVAAAFTACAEREDESIEVVVPGGKLNVLWKKQVPYLIGPAQVLGTMRWDSRMLMEKADGKGF